MRVSKVLGLGLVLVCTSAEAQDQLSPPSAPFPQAQIDRGAEVYSTYCMPCHGPGLDYPGGGFDLRTFPPEQFARFANSVAKGKNNMPPWGEVLQPGDLEALWAYVIAAEGKK
jgi:alcohol dehydrogenase (cytochrome c)